MNMPSRPRDWRLTAILLLVALPGLAGLLIGLFLEAPGHLELVMRDGVFDFPLAGRRTVLLFDGREGIYTPKPQGDGAAIALGAVPAGPHLFQWRVDGYEPGEQRITVEPWTRVPLTRIEATLRPQFGRIAVNAVNARTNERIAVPVTVTMDGAEEQTGSGVVSLLAPPGKHSLSARADGYCPAQKTATVAAMETAKASIPLPPNLGPDEVARIVLLWDVPPEDIDAHVLIKLDGEKAERHVYWKAMDTEKNERPVTALDVDMRHPGGFETVTIKKGFPGHYRYAVENFSLLLARANHRPEPANLTHSGATVRLYLKGSCDPQVFTVPSGCDDLEWMVMELAVDAAGNVTVNPENRCLKGPRGRQQIEK